MQLEVPKYDPQELLGPLGVAMLTEIKSSECKQLRLAFCRCVCKLGATSKRSVSKFGLQVSNVEWRDCRRDVRREAAGLPKLMNKNKGGRPSKVNNPAYVAAVREAFASMSKATCRLRRSRSDRVDVRGKKIKLKIRTLNSSKQCIFAQKLGKKLASVKLRSLYRIASKYCYEYVKPKKITDFCDICYHYDCKFLTHLKRLLQQCYASLHGFMASYFDEIGTEWLRHLDVSSDEFFELFGKLVHHISTHADNYPERRAAEVPYKSRLDLHNAEASTLNNLRDAHSDLKYFRWHFQTMARQAAVTISRFHCPMPSSVHLRYDYKELVRLPVGPKEPGSWFYSDYQTEITVLGGVMVFVNEQGVREVHYHTMVTNVIEHTPTTTIIFLRKMLEFLPPHCKVLDLWEDAGNHFRAYEVLYFQLGDVFDEHDRIDEVHVNLDPEHHGKGPCDAHFGVCDHWKNIYAADREIADYITLADAYRAGAATCHAFDPPPDGPRHHIHLMDMGCRPASLRKVDPSKMEGLSITGTYCVRGKRVSTTSAHRRPGCLTDIEVANLIFSDEVDPVKKWPLMYTVEGKGSDDWKIYKAPKSAKDMNYKSVIPKLRSRYEKQKACAKVGASVSRKKPLLQSEAAYEETLRRHSSKMKRVRTSWAAAATRAS